MEIKMTKKYKFRYDNHNITDEEYKKIIDWCGMYEISIKYIGQSLKRRCKWLQIEVDGFLANFVIKNWPGWILQDAK